MQHFAILVLRAVGENLGPVRGVVVLPRQLDMLGGIIAEAVHAIIDQLLKVGGHHVADSGVAIGVEIPQADQLAVGDLVTVVPVGNVAVIAVVMVIIVVLPAGGDSRIVRGHVIGHDVHNDTHAILVRGLAQALQVGFGSDDPVAYRGIGWLIDVIPVVGELHSVAGRMDCGHRLGLHRSKTSLGDCRNVLFDGLERPHPCMERGTFAHVLGETVLLSSRLESRIPDSVGITVSLSISTCRRGGRHTDDAASYQHGRRCDKGHEFMAPLPRYLDVSRHIRSFRELSPEYRNRAAVHRQCAVQRKLL